MTEFRGWIVTTPVFISQPGVPLSFFRGSRQTLQAYAGKIYLQLGRDRFLSHPSTRDLLFIFSFNASLMWAGNIVNK